MFEREKYSQILWVVVLGKIEVANLELVAFIVNIKKTDSNESVFYLYKEYIIQLKL